jgi:hypothetical protein
LVETGPEEKIAEPVSTVQPPSRPRIPTQEEQRAARSKSPALFAVIAAIAMLAMGFLALSRRDVPEKASMPPLVAAPKNVSSGTKTEGRIANADAAARTPDEKISDPAQPERKEPTQRVTETPSENTQPPVVTPVPVISRAFMVLEAAGNAPSQFEGRANWNFAEDPALRGEKSLRATIEFSAIGGLSVDFSIARNADPKLNASHTMMVIFDPKGGESISEMSAVEWRERESQPGAVLAGIVVPVQDNVFMFGLEPDERTRTRNLDLLRTQKWMVFEIRLASGRRGAVLVEKGANGDKAVSDALAAWK